MILKDYKVNFLYKYKNVFKYFLNLLFPPKCIICKNSKSLFNKKELCHICELSLTKQKSFYNNDLPDWIYYRYSYKDQNIKQIEYNIKYFHNKYLAREMGKYVYNFLYVALLEKFEILGEKYFFVPVPISHQRMSERGYNQAFEISLGINKNRTYQILKRITDTQKLFGLSEIERNNVLDQAFEIDKDLLADLLYREKLDIQDLHLIIVDDITTTGSTFYNIRKLLLSYGFKIENIYGFALAH